MRIVLDTNVIVSAFLSPTGTPAQLLAAWRQEAFELLVSGPILDEYRSTLGYDRLRARHHLTDDEIAEVVAEFRQFATFVSPASGLVAAGDVGDPDDAVFLECASRVARPTSSAAMPICSTYTGTMASPYFRRRRSWPFSNRNATGERSGGGDSRRARGRDLPSSAMIIPDA